MALNYDTTKLMHRSAWHYLFNCCDAIIPGSESVPICGIVKVFSYKFGYSKWQMGFQGLEGCNYFPVDYSSTNIIARRVPICQYH